ncbi:hypothetical protein M569_14128 [Genlisea aurea]|uniref:Nuclear matrix constituent protein 1-like protein n=1 Tax=Genlisea aurea TaxID=192259 RepID=S8C1U5_9LAMI|nr:hypothetical protein M569_14128 [Genlisea aurea]
MQKVERRLQEAEERHCQIRRHINERDEKITEFEGKLKERNLELEKKQKELQQLNLELKKKETEVFDKLADLSEKEEKAECAMIQLEIKEKQLAALGESLNARELVELEILLQGHRTALQVKEQEFELANEEKRKLLLEEHQLNLYALNRKLAEINHVEEKLKIREEALEKKSERAKEKEKEVHSMSKGVNSRKKTLSMEDKNLDSLRKEVDSEKTGLQTLNERLENIKAEISQQKMRVDDETAKLRMADDERTQHSRIVAGLKQEIESYRSHNDSLAIQIQHIKEDREKFEEEWNALDEKRDELAKSMRQLQEKTDFVENLKATERQLNKNKDACKEQISRELEYVRLSKESFEASMENDRSAFSKHADTEHAQLLQEFENYERQLEADMLEKEEEIVKSVIEKEAAFEAKIERENNNFTHLKEALQRESKVVSVEKKRLEQDKQTAAMEKLQVEASRSKMLEDVNELVSLSRKLKMHRTEFIRERQKLASFTESLRNCQLCGITARDYISSSLERSQEVDDKFATGEEILEKFAAYVEVDDKTSAANRSGGRISWLLQKCTPRIFSSRNGSSRGENAGLPSGLVAFPDVLIDSRHEKRSENLIADTTVVEDGKAFLRTINTKRDEVDPSPSSRAATALRGVPKKRKFPIDDGSDDRTEAASESAPTVGRRRKKQQKKESSHDIIFDAVTREYERRRTCAAPLENGTTKTDKVQLPESSNHTDQYTTDAGKPKANAETNSYRDENQKENSFSGSFQDLQYEEEEEEVEEASIQKKLWNFFTS